MKKRNLLLAVMAALTLSGCMLNQTEEKVYKSAEELPDDPMERMKASVSLCKFAGPNTNTCKDNVVYPKFATGYFYSQKYDDGSFTYLKQIPVNKAMYDKTMELAEKACTENSIAGYCKLYAAYYVWEDVSDINRRIKGVLYDMKACELGDLESCGIVLKETDAIHTYYKIDDEFCKDLFYRARNMFRVLVFTDVWGLRIAEMANYVYAPKSSEWKFTALDGSTQIRTTSSKSKEAIDMVYQMCLFNKTYYCAHDIMFRPGFKMRTFDFFQPGLRMTDFVREYDDDIDVRFNKVDKKFNLTGERMIETGDDINKVNKMKERSNYLKNILLQFND